MSQENVEIGGRFAEAWMCRDWGAIQRLADPNVEQHGTVGGVEEGRVTHGANEIRRDYENVEDMWEEHRVEIDQLIDAGDQVVIFQHEYMRGKSSGVELELDAAVLVDIRDGHIVRVQGFMDRAVALEAAGVSN